MSPAGAATSGGPPLLEVRGIGKRFGGLQAVRDLSFEMARGEVLGLIGPNGAGKTTVFHLLSGFLAPDGGDVRFDGRSLAGLKPHAICRLGLARTFQIVRPFPHLSVWENVRVGALARRPRMAEARERARGGDRPGGAGSQGRSRRRPGSPWPSASGSSWRARSPPSPPCCCSTR